MSTIQIVPLDKVVPTTNIRIDVDHEKVQHIAQTIVGLRIQRGKVHEESVAGLGLIQPATVYEEGGKFHLVTGRTRFFAMAYLRDMKPKEFEASYGVAKDSAGRFDLFPVLVETKPQNETDRVRRQFIENQARENLPAYDEAVVVSSIQQKTKNWEKTASLLGLIGKDGKPNAALAKVTGGLVKCPPAAIQAMKEKRLSKGDAQYTLGLDDDSCKDLLAKKDDLTNKAWRELAGELKRNQRGIAKDKKEGSEEGTTAEGGATTEGGSTSEKGPKETLQLNADQEQLRLLLESALSQSSAGDDGENVRLSVAAKASKAGAIYQITVPTESTSRVANFLVTEFGIDVDKLAEETAPADHSDERTDENDDEEQPTTKGKRRK